MKIGLLGMGTIGSGVFEIAQSLSGVECKKVLEKRFQAEYITDNIEEIVKDPEIELVVETMGGLHPAYEFAVQVLENKKHFVTANKLLVSVYGPELTALAKANGVGFLYGAACGGGIAYLANLEIARGIDRITSLGGILNGTTNYILDSMQSKGMDYAQALSEAQALGYAERDPSSDVDGLDTQRKLILACAVGFDAYLKPEDIPTAGISRVLALDTDWAKANGMVLRLCACAERNAENAVSAYVEPTLVAANAPEAAILSNVNYAWYKGESYGLMSYIGQGAGKLPTAANVLRDVKSISAGHRFMTSENCAELQPDNSAASHAYYVRIARGEAFPAEWIARKESAGEWDLYVTAAVSVQAMHEFMADKQGAFFAGIQQA